MPERRRSQRDRSATKQKRRLSATTADRHHLYQLSVQEVSAEIDFVDDTFFKARRRRASRLREDFCGTANTSCEWVRRRRGNTAVGLDLDQPTLDWGSAHNLARLKPPQRSRIRLLRRDVLSPGPGAGRMDAILAMNFSYWVFNTRALMGRYFRAVHRSLVRDGVFFLDFCGGWDCYRLHREVRPIRHRAQRFNYVWNQSAYNPITGGVRCHISFTFPDGSRLRRAFEYEWRLWTLPEIREILAEAGFRRVTVYWEGDDGKGGGDGVFTPNTEGEVVASFISYIVAEK